MEAQRQSLVTLRKYGLKDNFMAPERWVNVLLNNRSVLGLSCWLCTLFLLSSSSDAIFHGGQASSAVWGCPGLLPVASSAFMPVACSAVRPDTGVLVFCLRTPGHPGNVWEGASFLKDLVFFLSTTRRREAIDRSR